ncbi:unnamed protein product, partial [Ectocarpus fasciculatus]
MSPFQVAGNDSYTPPYRDFGSRSSSTSKLLVLPGVKEDGGGTGSSSSAAVSLSRGVSGDGGDFDADLADVSPSKGPVEPSSAPLPLPCWSRSESKDSTLVEPSSAPSSLRAPGTGPATPWNGEEEEEVAEAGEGEEVGGQGKGDEEAVRSGAGGGAEEAEAAAGAPKGEAEGGGGGESDGAEDGTGDDAEAAPPVEREGGAVAVDVEDREESEMSADSLDNFKDEQRAAGIAVRDGVRKSAEGGKAELVVSPSAAAAAAAASVGDDGPELSTIAGEDASESAVESPKKLGAEAPAVEGADDGDEAGVTMGRGSDGGVEAGAGGEAQPQGEGHSTKSRDEGDRRGSGEGLAAAALPDLASKPADLAELARVLGLTAVVTIAPVGTVIGDDGASVAAEGLEAAPAVAAASAAAAPAAVPVAAGVEGEEAGEEPGVSSPTAEVLTGPEELVEDAAPESAEGDESRKESLDVAVEAPGSEGLVDDTIAESRPPGVDVGEKESGVAALPSYASPGSGRRRDSYDMGEIAAGQGVVGEAARTSEGVEEDSGGEEKVVVEGATFYSTQELGAELAEGENNRDDSFASAEEEDEAAEAVEAAAAAISDEDGILEHDGNAGSLSALPPPMAPVSQEREAERQEEGEEDGAEGSGRSTRDRRSRRPPRPTAIALSPHDDDDEEGRQRPGALLLDFPRSPASSPGGTPAGGRSAGPASSLPSQQSLSSPSGVGGFPAAASSPIRISTPRSPSSPSRVGFSASLRARSPPRSPRRHPPPEQEPGGRLLETSKGPVWSPAQSPRRKSVARIGQTTPEQVGGSGSGSGGGSGKQTPRGGREREGGRGGSRRESSSSKSSLRRSSSSSVVARPLLSDGEDGGGSAGRGGSRGGGGGRRGSGASSLLSSVVSNAADDDSIPSSGSGVASGGKPKLRRVESLNNLREDGEEYGGKSESRDRSFTAANINPDALGLDLAAVVTHLKEDGLTPEKFQKSLQRNHHRTPSMPSPSTSSAGTTLEAEPAPAKGIRQQQQHRPPLWGVLGWIGDVAKVVTGQGGRGHHGEAEQAGGTATAADAAEEAGEAEPKVLPATEEDTAAADKAAAVAAAARPKILPASDETAAELAQTRAAAAALALAATASVAHGSSGSGFSSGSGSGSGGGSGSGSGSGSGGGAPPVAVLSAAATAEALEVAKRAAQAARDPRKDPEYAKFFNMLETGVPRETVELAMLMEGKYPAVLNTPLPGPAVEKITSTAAAEAAQVALSWAERGPGSSRPSRRERRQSSTASASSLSPRERRNSAATAGAATSSRSPRERRNAATAAASMSSRSPRERRRPRRGPGLEAAAEAAKEAVDGLVPARENPLYAGFFDMLSRGTPKGEVAAAMESEGVDAAVLDAPDALFPLPSPRRQGRRHAAAAAGVEVTPEAEPDRATSYAAEGAEAAAAEASKAMEEIYAHIAAQKLAAAEQEAAAEPEMAAAEAPPSKVAAKEHPEFFKFFKMLAMGMPKGAALQAMAKAGVDQAVLDTPDALLPLSAEQRAELAERRDAAAAAAALSAEAEKSHRGGGGGEGASPPAGPPKGMAPAKDHPDYQSYFKMMKMGIPRGAALQKMAKDGVDQAILDTPEALFSLPKSGGEAAAAAAAAPTMVAVKDHPDYQKYFKMLKMGLPRGAALQKMATEGVDQAILDTPDAMVPGPPVEAAGDGAPAVAAVAAAAAPSMVAAKDHPDYEKYFKMLRMGLPRGAALQKMATEGKDQAILDTPDAMLPGPPVETTGDGSPAVAAGAAAAA